MTLAAFENRAERAQIIELLGDGIMLAMASDRG